MIGYRISRGDLETKIEAHAPGWLGRAQTRTGTFIAAGRYTEKKGIWSEVKAVYMNLQGGAKCAYCERKLEGVELGLIEQDVEHFRPKASVKKWPLPAPLKAAGIVLTNTPAGQTGYFALPYDLFNYAAACKPCNSTLKKDRFPIKGAYDFSLQDPAQAGAEEAYLIYPVGDFDADPETLIEFHGLTPQARAANGFDRERALVTIAFFNLGDPAKRANLYRERAVLLMAILRLLEKSVTGSPASRATAETKLAKYLHPGLAHLNCAKCFVELFRRDQASAQRVAELAEEYITNKS